MVKLADTLALGANGETLGGSNPSIRTMYHSRKQLIAIALNAEISLKDMKLSNNSLLWPLEKWVTAELCRLTPAFLGTKSLSFLSLCSSLLILTSYYFAGRIPFLLFAASFFILAQWAFDVLDGAIGRLRKEGFVRWGFYIDHLFDYFFMSAVVFGFWFLIPQSKFQILILFFLWSSIMVNFFLFYSIVKDKEPDLAISFGRFSPIEFRLLVILFNTMFYFFRSNMRELVDRYLPVLNIILFAAVIVVIYVYQKKINAYDIGEKEDHV